MSYIISLKKDYRGAEAESVGENVELEGKSSYRFETPNANSDYITFSWDYIKNNKQYFNISNDK